MSKYIANSVQVPNAFFDEIMPKLSDAALRCYLVITRQTTGWQKQEDAISISQFVKKTGKSKPTVVKGCEELEKLGLITKVEAKNRTSQYSLNLSNSLTSKEDLPVKNIDSSCQKSLQEVVKTFDTQKPNKPTLTKPNKKNKQKKENPRTFKPEKPKEVSEQVWNDLLDFRKKRNLSDSKTAWSRILNQLEGARLITGHELDEIIGTWLDKGWTSFKSLYYTNLVDREQRTTGNQNHANNQPANSELNTANHFDDLRQQAKAKYGNSQRTSGMRTVS